MRRTYVRRGVVSLSLLGALVVVAPWAHARPSSPPRAERYVVRPGDTLWRIASSARPDSDPRPLIDRIEELNGLLDGQIRPGQALLIPETDRTDL